MVSSSVPSLWMVPAQTKEAAPKENGRKCRVLHFLGLFRFDMEIAVHFSLIMENPSYKIPILSS